MESIVMASPSNVLVRGFVQLACHPAGGTNDGAGLRIGSLFSGIGLLELGLEVAGVGHVVFQVESDPFCRLILAKHWPRARRYEDVCDVGCHNLPCVDVLCGGFPCQGLSVAGKRRGLADPRSGLWREFARIVEETRPRYVVVENVPGLVANGLDQVVGDLERAGYVVEGRILAASDVGAPHRRERLFLLAYADGERCAGSAARDGEKGGLDESHGRDVARRGDRDRATAANAARERHGAPGRQGSLTAGRGDARRRGAHVANADGDAIWQQPERDQRQGRSVRASERGDAEPSVGGARGGSAAESRLDRGAHGSAHRLDGRWPAGKGSAQHAWEPPRALANVPLRAHRLRALGNAVVPQVAAVVGKRLLEHHLATA
jgi:DNA (cytosine-5)-methyltransferase 1